MLKDAKYRACQKDLPFSLSIEDLFIPARCPVLGVPLRFRGGPHAPSLDRIVPELGYVPGNVLVVCQRVNAIKADATIAELERVAAFYRTHADVWVDFFQPPKEDP